MEYELNQITQDGSKEQNRNINIIITKQGLEITFTYSNYGRKTFPKKQNELGVAKKLHKGYARMELVNYDQVSSNVWNFETLFRKMTKVNDVFGGCLRYSVLRSTVSWTVCSFIRLLFNCYTL